MTKEVTPRPIMATAALLLALLLSAAGCKSVYYSTMEKLGKHKRDLLVDRVEDARDSQEKAKEKFKDALEQFRSVVNFQGGELEAKYNKLNGEYESAKGRADDVSKRIAAVRDVAKALFDEWTKELDQYQNADLRRSSERELRETRSRYNQLVGAMERAESKMQPVLSAFHDQVLFLKHNLNARAIASLQDEAKGLQTDIDALIADMERSINEANDFIKDMGKD